MLSACSYFHRSLAAASVTAAVAFTFTAAPAHAQHAFDSGPYIGLGVGYGKVTDRLSWHPDQRNSDPDDITESESVKKSGVVGSLYGGYNWRFNRVVVGLEADITGGSLKYHDRSHSRDLDSDYSEYFKYRMSWFASLRPRVGYLINESLLLYGTAGVAMARVKTSMGGNEVNHMDSSQDFSFRANEGSRRVHGWIAGAGFEYALTNDWHIRGEYLHARFNRKNYDFSASSNDGERIHHNGSIRPRVNQVRIGMTYQF